jgi:hypothetical protein
MDPLDGDMAAFYTHLIPACTNRPTCNFTPSVSGRFYALTVLMTAQGTTLTNAVITSAVVRFGCDFFNRPPSDTILANTNIQVGLRELWRNSNPEDTNPANRKEQGGWIVRRKDGSLHVEPMAQNSSPTVCQTKLDGAEALAIVQRGDSVLGYVHTHPHDPGKRPPANCTARNARQRGARYGDGPSPPDYIPLLPGSGFVDLKSYIVDKRHVHRLDPGDQFGDPFDTYPKNTNCKA